MIATLNVIRITDDYVGFVFLENDTIDIETSKIVYISKKEGNVFCLYLINNHRIEIDGSELHKLKV